MSRFIVPNCAGIHTARSLMEINRPFEDDTTTAILQLHPRWAHMEPVALAMAAAWGAWQRRHGRSIRVENLGPNANYAARMHLFQHLGAAYAFGSAEHDERGRFLPLTQVRTGDDVRGVIGDLAGLLYLEDEPDGLAAVKYCVSELLRNVLEHSGSPDGAFVCAHRYTGKTPRVRVAVADCGAGIAGHLGQAHWDASIDDLVALGLAMQLGITGAVRGVYGTSNNAGAGLFFTRGIAKGTGGYFLLISERAGYRLRRWEQEPNVITPYPDPFDEPRSDRWRFEAGWRGTVVGVEIRTDRIADYQYFFQWMQKNARVMGPSKRRIRFA